MKGIVLLLVFVGCVECHPGGGCLEDMLLPPGPSMRVAKAPGVEALNWDNLTPDNRTLCPETPENRPGNRVNSTEKLEDLRAIMVAESVDAYLVEYRDEHGSGGADYDRRIRWLNGYSGSSGFVWVTANKAALWTDGRYFLQADQQMDCNWILMEQGETGYPTAYEWITSELSSGDRAGADPKLVSIAGWQGYESTFAEAGINMVEIDDLIDEIWTDDRDPRPNNDLIIHTLDYTGETWIEKVTEVRRKLTEEDADALVLTALDDTAWTFNLRGSDRLTSPLFYSYAIITQEYATLFLSNFEKLIELKEVQDHLNTTADGTCGSIRVEECVQVKEYNSTMAELVELNNTLGINKIWLGPGSNYASLSAIKGKEYLVESPTQLMKSVKNEVERRRYKECQIRDSAALVIFAAFLEAEIKAGNEWTEVSAARKLKKKKVPTATLR